MAWTFFVAPPLARSCWDTWSRIFQGAGIVGVIVFFVLSGYLITNVLVRDIERHRKIRYGRFYAHRAFRLVPALISLLGVYAAVEMATDVLGDRSKGIVGYTILAGLGYLKDLPLPFDVSMAIGPLWTLAVEEQFYLLWPALLVFALPQPPRAADWLVHRRRPVPHVGQCAGHDDPGAATSRPGLRAADHVGAGPDHRLGPAPLPAPGVPLVLRPPAPAGGPARVGGDPAGLIYFPKANETPSFMFIGGPLAMLASAVLVTLAASRTAVMPHWTRPLQLLGGVSYAAYLWNYVVILWLNGGSTADLPPLVAVSAIVLTLVIAAVSWHTVERLGRIARARFDERYPDRRPAAGKVDAGVQSAA